MHSGPQKTCISSSQHPPTHLNEQRDLFLWDSALLCRHQGRLSVWTGGQICDGSKTRLMAIVVNLDHEYAVHTTTSLNLYTRLAFDDELRSLAVFNQHVRFIGGELVRFAGGELVRSVGGEHRPLVTSNLG